MDSNNTSTIAVDERLLNVLSGPKKLKLLLEEQAGSITRWAVQERINPVEVWHTLAGRREYQAHRDLIAKRLEISREEVDRLISETMARPASVDPRIRRV